MRQMTQRPDAAQQIAFLKRLRATRQFTSEPLPEAALRDILEVARWSGSASNTQPWEFLIVRDAALRDRLAELSGTNAGHLRGAQLGLVLILDGDDESMESYDEGRLSERIMLAADAHGIGACIGWLEGDGQRAGKEALGIPQHKFVRTIISLGYPDTSNPRPKRAQARKPLDALLHEERY
jgi:nitroreductase